MSDSTLKYFDIAWSSSMDGPGTRVVLFLQGCHLQCPWCHSPHSLKRKGPSPLLFFESRCSLCGTCVETCTEKVHRIEDGKHLLDRSRCKSCGDCVLSCPSSRSGKWNVSALGLPVQEKKVRDIYHLLRPQLELLQDLGGLTVSGGEPLLQAESLVELLELCTKPNFHKAVETSLSLPRHHLEAVVDSVDHWLIGLRPVEIPVGTNNITNIILQDWEKVMTNLEFLTSRRKDNITVRLPVIPGYTDKKECLIKIANVMEQDSLEEIEILPFNPYADHYYMAMGLTFPLEGISPPGDNTDDLRKRVGLVKSFAGSRGGFSKEPLAAGGTKSTISPPGEEEIEEIKTYFSSRGLNARIIREENTSLKQMNSNTKKP